MSRIFLADPWLSCRTCFRVPRITQFDSLPSSPRVQPPAGCIPLGFICDHAVACLRKGTQLCHTPCFATPCFTHHPSPHHLSHTTLSHSIFRHTIFHTPSFATPSFTHYFVKHHLSPHKFSPHHLSHAIFHASTLKPQGLVKELNGMERSHAEQFNRQYDI